MSVLSTGSRVVPTLPAPTFEVGQLVLVSIPGLGYQDVLAEIVKVDRPLAGSSEIIILADKRHREVRDGGHSRTLPNRALRLATREEIIAGLAATRKQFHIRMPSAKRLKAIEDGWGFQIKRSQKNTP